MDYEDLGPAMTQAANRDATEALKKRVAALEQEIAALKRPMRECICSDPEKCIQAVPGYRCKAGRVC
jgi:hypothetical protein